MPNIYIWPVKGMNCASCERVIGDALKKLTDVEEVEVSLAKKKAGIRMKEGAAAPDMAAINASLASHGYVLGEAPAVVKGGNVCVLPSSKPLKKRLWMALFAVASVAVAYAFIVQPLQALLPAAQASASLLALIGLGVVASCSTCLASTGAFFLAVSSASAGKKNLLPMHLGRVLGFLLGGAALGALGSALPSSPFLYGGMGLLLGIGFFFVGLNLLELSPSLASLGIRLPLSMTSRVEKMIGGSSFTTSALAGAASFVLPCGFTQTAQALALASGSALQGALMMGAFALGTLPVLYGVTAFGSFSAWKTSWMKLVAGATLVLFAVGQTDGALTVLGSPYTVSGLGERLVSPITRAFEVSSVQAQEQRIGMKVGGGAFTPNRFTLKRGVPVRWEIDGVDISGCASSIVAPTLGVSRNLVKGMNVIEFTPKEDGVVPFSCSMGMIRGSFTVVD